MRAGAGPGRAAQDAKLETRVLDALDGRPATHFRELTVPTGAASQSAVARALASLRAAGRVESPRPGVYALPGAAPGGDRGAGVPEKMRAIFADGQVHRTRDLVAALSCYAAPVAIRHAVKVLAKKGEIVNTATGCWRLNDGATPARPALPPARERLLDAAAGLADGWSLADLTGCLADRNDPMPRETVRKTLYQLTGEGRIARLAHGRYRTPRPPGS